jgi:hypothetical protein
MGAAKRSGSAAYVACIWSKMPSRIICHLAEPVILLRCSEFFEMGGEADRLSALGNSWNSTSPARRSEVFGTDTEEIEASVSALCPEEQET